MKFSNVTPNQAKLARKFEQAGLCSYSQALKAFDRRDDAQIEAWKKELAKKEAESK